MKIKVGQIWEILLSPKIRKSPPLLIIKMIEIKDNSIIYHLSIKNIRINKNISEITHIPISKYAFDLSVGKFKGMIGDSKDEDFEDAYQIWQNDNGGVWDIPIDEIIQYTINNI